MSDNDLDKTKKTNKDELATGQVKITQDKKVKLTEQIKITQKKKDNKSELLKKQIQITQSQTGSSGETDKNSEGK